jgi:hypothetical protein
MDDKEKSLKVLGAGVAPRAVLRKYCFLQKHSKEKTGYPDNEKHSKVVS